MTEPEPIYLDQPVAPPVRPLDGPAQLSWPSGTLLVATDLHVLRRRAAHKRQRQARRAGRRQRRG